MRYRLLGDLLSIKSALLYKRGYVDSTFSRNPSEQMNATKTNQSSHASFMEYNFKFNIDKGAYSSFNLSEYLSDSTLSLLSENNETSSIPSNLLMYQISSDVTERNYSIFEIFDSGSSTEMILNIDKDIQKIEFFSEFLNYTPDESGLFTEVKEYSFTNPDLSSLAPIMVIEFGPEESYEPEDYYNKDEMPIKPEWDEDSEKSYQFDLEEYTNTKFLTISTTSAEREPIINLSLSAHKSQIDPHRNQEEYVVSNKEFRSTLRDVGNSIGKFSYSDIVMDNRSNTILGTENVLTDLPLLADRSKIRQVEINGVLYDDYLDYIVYNKGDKVHYKGEAFISLIDGNLYENPSISPMWQSISTIDDPELPEDYNQPHVVNVRVNNHEWGTADPIGPVNVEYRHELFVNIITDNANVKAIYVDGLPQIIHDDKLFTLSEVVSDHDLLIEFDPIYHDVNIEILPDSEYGSVTGQGSYLQNTSATVTAIPYYGYEFVGWYENDVLLSEDESYTLSEINQSHDLVAKFDKKKYIVTIECNEGGTYLPKDGNPTKVTVIHGESLEVTVIPFTGYEIEYIKNGDKIDEYYDLPTYTIEDIQSNVILIINFSRHQLHIDDPVLGRINYVVIGDQLWSTSDIGDRMSNLEDGYYLDFNEMKFIDTVARDNIGFRIPSKSDWEELYSYLGDKKSALSMKSPEITRFNSEGWKDSIYRGLGRYRLNFMPYGYYLEDDGFIGRNEESVHWSTTLNDTYESVTASLLLYDSPIGFFKEISTESCKMPVRLMSDAYKVNLLGKSYRYISLSIQVDVRVVDNDDYSYNDVYETYEVTQDWVIDNLDYTDLGTRFEESECDKFGSLYNLDETLQINELLQYSGFRVPTNLDYIFLEKYLGYGRDQINVDKDGIFDVDLDTYINGYIGTVEAKRMKSGDFIYSGIDWKGYETKSLDNSQLNVLPSGYAVEEDGDIGYKSMGTSAKFWTSSVIDSDGTVLAHSRTISYSNDKVLRGVYQGSKNYMSIRPVRTNIRKIQ